MMEDGADVMEYLELQGNLKMLTKGQLLERVREQGARISDRQLTTYITEGLVPRSMRIGSRTGGWPEIVARLVTWVSMERRRGLSVDAIRELLPLWKFLVESFDKGEVNLKEFEYRARQHITRPEAAFAAPTLFYSCAPCPSCLGDRHDGVTYVDMNGDPHPKTKPMAVNFELAEMDEEGVYAESRMSVRILLPQAEVDDPATRVVLGVPNGVPFRPRPEPEVPVALTVGALERDEEVITRQEEGN